MRKTKRQGYGTEQKTEKRRYKGILERNKK